MTVGGRFHRLLIYDDRTLYSARSDAKLSISEEQLYQLKKSPDTPMSKHIDEYSGIIERIQFHLPHDKRWNDESINYRFVRNLPMQEWLPWIRATGDRIAEMHPAQLYAEIQLDDEVLHGPSETPNEASLGSHSRSENGRNGGKGGKDNGSEKCNKRGNGSNKKHKRHRFQPYDGIVFDGRPPTANYVKSMKEKYGSDYHECKFCHWPGYMVNDCNNLKRAKPSNGNLQVRNHRAVRCRSQTTTNFSHGTQVSPNSSPMPF
jgi:hypothetical protein